MSRSRKKPIVRVSNPIDKEKAHKVVRRRVRAELHKPNPDPFIIDGDTRELGQEDWGTKFGFDYLSTDPEEAEQVKKKSRK